MNIKEYCEKTQSENYYVQVHYRDFSFDEPSLESDHIIAVEDSDGNHIGYLIGDNDGDDEFWHKEDIRWFRILKERLNDEN